MTKVIIIALIIFAVLIIVNNLRGKKTDGAAGNGGTIINAIKKFINGKNPNSGDTPNQPVKEETPRRGEKNQTMYMATWSVCVLDPETEEVVKQKDIVLSPEKKEFRIGYSDACDLVLDSAYVGRVHLRIGKDDQGYFAMDNDTLNGTFINDCAVSSFSLEEGVIVYVADVPIRFVRKKQRVLGNNKPSSSEDNENATKRMAGFTKINENEKENNGEIPLKR